MNARNRKADLDGQEHSDKLLRSALYYARMGIPVFPLKPLTKVPMTTHGLKDATTDEHKLKHYWSDEPNANVGAVMGAISGFLAIDIDDRHGGYESLAEIEKTYGSLPKTPQSLTGGGGSHFLFRHPGGNVRNRVNLFPGIDVRADGGYIVLPPSIHQSGRIYSWEISARIDEVPAAQMPQWLLDLLMKEKHQSSQTPGEYWSKLIAEGACEGQRNASAASLAGHLLRKFVDARLVLELILLWNAARNNPPLPLEEIIKTVDSICRLERERRLGGAQ